MPTRGRASSSRSRGRSSSTTRDETRARDTNTSSGEEDVTLGNTPNANREDDASPTDSNERRVKRRGSNQGTPRPDSPGQRLSIVIKSDTSFDKLETSREIGCLVRGFTGGRYMCYPDVPKDLDENMFKAFGDKFKWPTNRDADVHRVFRNVASNRLRDSIYDARQYAKKESHSNNPLDWRPYKPVWIDAREWIKLIEEFNTEEWQNKSIINSQNRASTAKGSHPKHTAGSVTFAVIEERMAEELGRPPTAREIFIRTHTTESGDFIDSKAHETLEKYNDTLELKWADPIERPEWDPELWIEVIDGIEKGCRVYGLGSSQASVEVIKAFGGSRVHSKNTEIEALKKQLVEAKEKLQREQMEAAKQMENLEASFDARVDARVAAAVKDLVKELLEELGFPNSIFPSSSGTKH